MPSCCPACRVLALDNARRCAHCGTDTVPPDKLARPMISGVTAITKPPPKGWRDTVALLTTSFGIFGGVALGGFYFGPTGALLGPAVGLLGYTKQFWRTAFKRRDRVVPIDPPRPPPGDRLLGIAQPHERALDLDNAPAQPLVVASIVGLDGGVIARRIESVPFWLVLHDKRRILVGGILWLASANPERLDAAAAREGLAAAGIPLTRAERKRISLWRTVLCAGDSFSALGTVAPEQLAGGGYRDHLIDSMRGPPGHPLWLDRLETEPTTP
jgi:hypothetical protein